VLAERRLAAGGPGCLAARLSPDGPPVTGPEMKAENRGYWLYLARRPSLPGPVALALFEAAADDWDVVLGLACQRGLPPQLVGQLWTVANGSSHQLWLLARGSERGAGAARFGGQLMRDKLQQHYPERTDLWGPTDLSAAEGAPARQLPAAEDTAVDWAQCLWRADGLTLRAQPGRTPEDSDLEIGTMSTAALAHEVISAHNFRLVLNAL